VSDVLAEIKRLYYGATRASISRDFDRAIDLLKSLPTEEERERATVYMQGLADMRAQWTSSAKSGVRSAKLVRSEKSGSSAKSGVQSAKLVRSAEPVPSTESVPSARSKVRGESSSGPARVHGRDRNSKRR
jgi:hypothetical protein